MTYQVVYATREERLEDQVNRLIAEGWKPQGGVAVLSQGSKTVFYQAMVK